MVSALAYIISLVFGVVRWAIIIRALLSWVPRDSPFNPYNPYCHPIVTFLIQFTEPVLAPLRPYTTMGGMMDLSPLVAIVGLWIIESVLLVILGVTPSGGFLF